MYKINVHENKHMRSPTLGQQALPNSSENYQDTCGEINGLEKMGIIEKSLSPWASPTQNRFGTNPPERSMCCLQTYQ